MGTARSGQGDSKCPCPCRVLGVSWRRNHREAAAITGADGPCGSREGFGMLEVKGWSSRSGLSQLCLCQAPAKPRPWDRKGHVSISQEQERFHFPWFPEHRSWHTLGLPSTVLRWGRFLSGTRGMCQILWKTPLTKSLWDGSFPLLAGPFLGSCLNPGQGLCVRATFALLPNLISVVLSLSGLISVSWYLPGAGSFCRG